MDTKSLILSPKIRKTDKYIPPDILQRLYDTADDIRDLFFIMCHCETDDRISDIVNIKRKGREKHMGQEIRNIEWDRNRIYTYDHKKDQWRYDYFPVKVRSKLKLWLKERQTLGLKGRELFPSLLYSPSLSIQNMVLVRKISRQSRIPAPARRRVGRRRHLVYNRGEDRRNLLPLVRGIRRRYGQDGGIWNLPYGRPVSGGVGNA